ncbi:hypothetical protein L4F39_00755 [Vibrio paracholerae]|uniref:hypothetical protein n=1 Tax=Vibrio paracholerae TaxID=650003 RepID=UPI00209437F1|nr:hypothetical protein [Vibrio paracholerae]MCO7065255.1 hypothetical protein [Vibrio paracholerae]
MDFETATDQELNVKLTELELTKRYPQAKSIEFDGRQNCFWVNSVGFSSFKVEEYCTDISATWPLMIEHGVSVNALSGGDYKAFEIYEKSGLHGNDIADENGLLRAVVVCLIKVLESKHERT